ncbi:glycerol-3-phosphate acyltransferase [Irregularibacter muris]|uniref:Glycerol-3-phosphate acyltransferase n=1 Tax=Irregularibacter muris TaxID=1796619 RepID=A0AAE3HI32_9FIRM|nr:glycerol-3-phosphate acyltransferase [Irregularibacter muris]MCR1899344.1 glycerol-3-phosphate acyltransferase [Irregularibacter muris]
MEAINIISAAIVGYLLGCFQTAYLVGKLVNNIDIRKFGTHNAGASNITTVMGWKYGIITALGDILKAMIAVWAFRILFPSSVTLAFIAGAAAILGHIFPFFLKFRGGKGAASLVGMAVAYNTRIGLILIFTIIVITIVTDYIALGTIGMFTLLPILSYYYKYPFLCIFIGIGLMILSLFKHRENIIRTIRHEEIGLRQVIEKNKK